MFAGPNGSGKSTLKEVLPKRLLGIYTNPDEIEKNIRRLGYLDFSDFGVLPEKPSLFHFLHNSTLINQAGLIRDIDKLRFSDTRLEFGAVEVNAYHASVLADYIRRCLLDVRETFTLETVMSSSSKVALLQEARSRGYRTYLYYVATESPEINISRVHNRVLDGGHDVPVDKITSRYHRSLALLRQAISLTDRAFLFDNSGHKQANVWIAEITEGIHLEMRTELAPA